MDDIIIIEDDTTQEIIEDLALPDEGETIHLMTERMRIGEVRYSAFPMEYPPTSLEGIAIVYNIEGWDSHEPAFNNVRIKCWFMTIPTFNIIYYCNSFKRSWRIFHWKC